MIFEAVSPAVVPPTIFVAMVEGPPFAGGLFLKFLLTDLPVSVVFMMAGGKVTELDIPVAMVPATFLVVGPLLGI
jgi:hypothetical protein